MKNQEFNIERENSNFKNACTFKNCLSKILYNIFPRLTGWKNKKIIKFLPEATLLLY